MSTGSVRTYRGRSPEERSADRRRRFLDAGLEVFSSVGYAHSSVSDLCRAAGLSRRQFYEEFSDRQALMLALYDGIQEEARAAVRAALASADTADLSRLARAVMTGYVEAIGSDPRRARIAFVEIVGIGDDVEEHRLAQRHEWAGMLEQVVGVLPGTRPPTGGFRLAGAAFIGAVNGVVHEWTLTEPRPPVSELSSLLAELLVALVT